MRPSQPKVSGLTCALGVLLAVTGSCGGAAPSPVAQQAKSTADQPPNFIFIFADDWGFSDLGIHGSTFCKTPHLDRMAAQGTDFLQFTVSNPVCSPSRTAVMTGQFPARHSVHQHFATMEHHRSAGMPDWLDPQAPMLPRMLKAAGYATGHFGKWHLSNNFITDAPLPPAYGIDEYGAFNLPANAPEQMPTHLTVPRAIDFIRRHAGRPFFLNVWIHETHTPHYPREEYLTRFAHLDEQHRVYAAVVAEADAWVGRLLDTLDALNLSEKTLVIFSSDNGPEWTFEYDRMRDDSSTGPGYGAYYSVGEKHPLKGRKRSLYAGGIRVPFIARWPGVVPAGQVDRTSVLTAVDILPTFLEIAGVSLPSDYEPDGESFLHALRGRPAPRQKPIFWEWRAARDDPETWPHLGIRDGPWKLLLNRELGRVELYNIAEDWPEAMDLADARPDVVQRLEKLLAAWQKTLPTTPPKAALSKARSEATMPPGPSS